MLSTEVVVGIIVVIVIAIGVFLKRNKDHSARTGGGSTGGGGVKPVSGKVDKV